MKYSAIKFLNSKLSEKSQVFLLCGNSTWIRRQIKEKLQGRYGMPILVSGKDEEEIESLGDIVCASPLLGVGAEDAITYVRVVDVSKTWVNKKVEHIFLPPKGSIVLVELDHTTTIRPKEFDQWKTNATLHAIVANHPNDATTKLIVTSLVNNSDLPKSVNKDKLIKTLIDTYGSDLEAIENNVEKVKLYGVASWNILDQKETSIKDSWRFVDNWMEGDIAKALYHFNRLTTSQQSTVATHKQIIGQMRKYVAVCSGSKPSDYFSRLLLRRLENRAPSWVVAKYAQILAISPIDLQYEDLVIRCLFDS